MKLTLEQVTLSGKPCDHMVNANGSMLGAWNNSICSLCNISYDEYQKQRDYQWFLWRSVVKKLNLKWESINGTFNVAFLYDFDYVSMEPVYENYKRVGEKAVPIYKKLVVIDQKAQEKKILNERFFPNRDQILSYDEGRSPEVRALRVVSTRAPNDGPKNKEWFKIISWACEQDLKILDYVLKDSVKDFLKNKSKNETIRKSSKAASDLAKADKFHYTDQCQAAFTIVNQKVREDLASVGIVATQYFNILDSGISYNWTGPKAYLLNIRNDSTLDITGQKLYDAIIDIFGKEKGDDILYNSTSPVLKRLCVCILGDVAVGLVEDNAKIRLAAEKILKKQVS